MEFIINGIYEAFLLLINFDEETYSAIWVSILTSSISIFITLILAMPIGFMLGFYDFKFKKALKILSDTMLAIPSVALGLIIYAFISRDGPLGFLGMLFTLKAIILGQICLAAPIVISLTSSAVENMDKKHLNLIKSYHLSSFRTILVVLYEIRYSLIIIIITAYARIIAEVGVAMMVGGNIKWHTRTITTAISLESNKGEFSTGIALACVLIFIAFVVNLAIFYLKKFQR